MARSQFWDTAIDQLGNAITTSRVTVYEYGTSTLSTVYANEIGSTLKGNPFNATTGFIDFWMEPGSYDVVIADTAIPAAYITRTVRFDSIPGINGVVSQTILDNAVIGAKIPDETITYLKTAKDTTNQLGRGAFMVGGARVNGVYNGALTGSTDTITWGTFLGMDDSNAVNESTGIFTSPDHAMYLVNINLEFYIASSGSSYGAQPYWRGGWAGPLKSISGPGGTGVQRFNASFLAEILAGYTASVQCNMYSAVGSSISIQTNDTATSWSMVPLYRMA